MKGITTTKQISLSLTADDRELYTESNPGPCDAAAAAINTVESAFNTGKTRLETARMAITVMHTWQDQGAVDTEPLTKLEEILDELYGKER